MKESSTTSLDLNGLHLPELPSWFPLAWGWWASLAKHSYRDAYYRIGSALASPSAGP